MCPPRRLFFFFFFNDTATTEIYTLSLHDALPICVGATFCARRGKEAEPLQGLHHERQRIAPTPDFAAVTAGHTQERAQRRSEEHTSEIPAQSKLVCRLLP